MRACFLALSLLACHVEGLAAVPELKAKIGRLSANTANGVKASPEISKEIASIAEELESVNPSGKPATSNLLDGKWQLVYTTTRGGSAGELGPFVGDVFQEIDVDAGSYVNVLELLPLKATLGADWDVLGPDMWTVNFRNIAFSLAGFNLSQKTLEQTGTWRMTYLDDDFRILRAQGRPDAPFNLYVLKKIAPSSSNR